MIRRPWMDTPCRGRHTLPAVRGADRTPRVEQPRRLLAEMSGGRSAPAQGSSRRRTAEVEVEPLQTRDGRAQCRVSHAVEVLVGEVRHAGASPEELDEHQSVDGSASLPAAAFVDAEQRRQVFDRRVADGRASGGSHDEPVGLQGALDVKGR